MPYHTLWQNYEYFIRVKSAMKQFSLIGPLGGSFSTRLSVYSRLVEENKERDLLVFCIGGFQMERRITLQAEKNLELYFPKKTPNKKTNKGNEW